MAQIQPTTTYESLLYSTVRLELPLRGSGPDPAVGTAFCFDHFPAGGQKITLLVTNRHVVEDSKSVSVRFHRRDAADTLSVNGYVDLSLSVTEHDWTGHPDPGIDLCAIRLDIFQQEARRRTHELAVFALSSLAVPDDLTAFDAVEEIVMIGYPSGLWDSANNYPLFRRGITASHPGVDYEGKPRFVVDTACFAGSSGSPVLLPRDSGGVRVKRVPFFDEGGRTFAFLGVLADGPYHDIEGEIEGADSTSTPVRMRGKIPMHLGYVIKSREVAVLAEHIANRP
jgi:hypothetical protein